jgi:hypothetical protein
MRFSGKNQYFGSETQYTLPFFMASCAALFEKGWITETEADTFRLTLKDYNSMQDGHRGASLLQALKTEQSIVLDTLLSVLGDTTLHQLLLRWSLSQIAVEVHTKLKSFSRDLLQKSELLFNRSFFLFEGDRCEKRTFFSFFITDFAEKLFESSEGFRGLVDDLKLFPSTSSWNSTANRGFESLLAQHLGLHLLDGDSFQAQDLQKISGKMIFHLESSIHKLSYFNEQLNHNLSASDDIELMEITKERLLGHLSRLKSIVVDARGSLDRLEYRRQTVIGTYKEILECLESIHQTSLDALKTSKLKSSESEASVPSAEFREILGVLLDRGVSFKEAKNSQEKLEAYCAEHRIHPADLLETELSKAHPFLTHEAIQSLRASGIGHAQPSVVMQEKARAISQKDKILRALSQAICLFCMALPVVTFLSVSCGVKTAPRSEILDLRPALPYHANQRAKPEPDMQNALQTSD